MKLGWLTMPLRFLAALTLLLALPLAGCRPRETAVEAARHSRTLLVGNGAEPADLDPHIAVAFTDSTLLVTVDGQRDYKVSDGQPVSITLATTRLPLVQRRDYAHFSVVRSKLNWNGGVAPRTKA